MPPRATWKGHLKISLVSFGVRLYNATSSASRITLNQLHHETHARLKQRMQDPTTDELAERDEIVKGYEYEKGKYVIIDPADLEKIKLESTKTIEIERFVDEDEIDTLYLNAPYFIAPDGPVAEQGFRVMREAMRDKGKVGIGRVVLTGREHVVAIGARGRGMEMSTLRYANEVKDADSYFEDIANGEVDKAQLEMAERLIESLEGEFEPELYTDGYQDALMKVITSKIEGSEPVIVQEQEAAKTLNFMEALRASVGGDAAPKKTAKAPAKKTAKKAPKKPPAKSVSTSKKKVRKQA